MACACHRLLNRLPGVNKQQYAVSSYGQRFLVNLAADEGPAAPITLILNGSSNPELAAGCARGEGSRCETFAYLRQWKE